jgi:carboxylesterase type B
MANTITLQHKALGEVTGLREEHVARFLGVKYASLEHRFETSQVLEYGASPSAIDATKIGFVHVLPSQPTPK